MNIFKAMAVRSVEEATRAIPVIDFGPALRGQPGGLDAVAGEVRRACEQVGFFYLAGHGVPPAVVDAAFRAAREFHGMPLEEKLALRINENNIGYLAVNQSIQGASTVHKATRPNYNESFFISHDRDASHPDVLAGTPLRGRNQWPEGREGMRSAMVRYFETLEGLGEGMLPVLARALDMPPGHFSPFFRNEAHINLRFLHYPPQDTEDDEQFGQGPHTDNSFVTMLAREDVPGLAVRLPGGEWLAPPVIPGTFLVNLGNIMKRWSNDRFLSTPHGVLNDSGTDRYSIAFFYSPNVETVIECLPTCVGPGDPARYPPAVYRDLVLEFYNANYFHRQAYAGSPQTAG
ncbi:MAG TPA: 2-oxoglutarate and iron-dependent oxygenase domain-containing protein [Methylomirabilota bacterium]|jgi:isopenicillin N synthase-like dioxygenase|nr:2-oxoglutarate and iron-dependent oxygenase domain-containing protein [Methylomirabilota bacterium]